jgi:predicted nucleic acid-binding protein
LGFATAGPIIQEVLQGVRADHKRAWFKQLFLAVPRLSDPVPLSIFLEAAEIYAQGRRQGYTIRSSTDCLIAAIAIENGVPVWHRDRDFSSIARFTPLRAYRRLEQARH